MSDIPDRTKELDAWVAAHPPEVVTKPQHFQPSPWDALMQRLTTIEARLAALEAKGSK